jgi:hypothetical protein
VPPEISIEGVIPQDLPARVKVSHTLDFDNNSGYPSITDATVKIWNDAGEAETLYPDKSGWYIAENIRGIPGVAYHLSVTYDGREYTAASVMPPQVLIDTLSLFKMPVMDYPFPVVHFDDPQGSLNEYYRFIVFVNDLPVEDMRDITLTAEFMDGRSIQQLLPLMSRHKDAPVRKGDKITVEMQCLEKGAYTFFETLGRMGYSLTNPTSNIKGGALGYFSAYSADCKEIIADW